MADVALVSLGATPGLRAADEEFAASLRRAGASVDVVSASAPRDVRTFALTDLTWALAARRAAAAEVVGSAQAVVYSTITAALLWPRPGAIRLDSLAYVNRPGRHGIWQRPVERRRLRQASLLVPQSLEALTGAPAALAETVVVHVPVEPSGPLDGERDIAAITYGAQPEKKGLDRVLLAWALTARSSEELLVCGVDPVEGERCWRRALADDAVATAGDPSVRFVGTLPRDEYRSLLRRSRTFVTAPRREEHGIAQLEALADGCVLVTNEAPGPYLALPIARELDRRLVVGAITGIEGGGRDRGSEGTLVDGLATAIRTALDDPAEDYAVRAAAALAPFSHAAVDAVVANELLPRLIR